MSKELVPGWQRRVAMGDPCWIVDGITTEEAARMNLHTIYRNKVSNRKVNPLNYWEDFWLVLFKFRFLCLETSCSQSSPRLKEGNLRFPQ